MFPFYVRRSPDDPEPEERIAYIAGRGGAFVRKATHAFRATVATREFPMLADVREQADYLLPPLPPQLVAQALAFFRGEYQRHHGEAILLLSFHPRRGTFRLDAPPQRVSPARVEYDLPLRAAEGFEFAGTIHSHGAITASHSHVDRRDESVFDGIHATIGDLDRRAVSAAASLVVSGRRFPLPVERVLGGLKKVPGEHMETQPPAEALPMASLQSTRLSDLLTRIKVRRRKPKLPIHGGVPQHSRSGYVPGAADIGFRAPFPIRRWESEGYVLSLPPGTDPRECVPDSDWQKQVTVVVPEPVRYYGDGMEEWNHQTILTQFPLPTVGSAAPLSTSGGKNESGLDGSQSGLVRENRWPRYTYRLPEEDDR